MSYLTNINIDNCSLINFKTFIILLFLFASVYFIQIYCILENRIQVTKLEHQLMDKQSIISEKTEVSFI